MKKLLGGVLKAVGAVFILLVVIALAFGGSDDKESSKGSSDSSSAQAEAAATDDGEAEDAAEAEDEGTKSDESAKESDESAQENKTSLSDDYIRPELQEFCDAYVAFYREYADYMKQYNEDPSNAELMSGLASMMQREADMVEASDGWEAEDMTPAEEALYTKTTAEVLRINAEILESSN